MNLQKKLLLGVGVALVLGVAGLFYPASKTVVDSTKVDVNAIANAVLAQVQSQLPVSAANAPAVINGCVDVEGTQTCSRAMNLSTATNTPCRLLSPSATSTLLTASLRIAVGSSTASAWDLSKGTSAWATSTATNFIRASLASAAQGTLYFATSTTASGNFDQTTTFAPNTYLVGSGMGYVPADTSKFLGRCEAVFQII